MLCPDCGVLMNRHAEKILKEASKPQSEDTVVSIHCCPACGKSASEMDESEPPQTRPGH